MEMLSQKQKIIAIGIIILIGFVILFQYINSTKEIYGYEESEIYIEDSEKTKEKNMEKQIVVHVTGAVNKERDCESKGGC